MEIRIPVMVLDPRYESDWIQIGVSIIFVDMGRASSGQVSEINMDLSDGFNKVKVHESPK